jgi:hypothetical protein
MAVKMTGSGTGRMNLAVNHLIAASGFSRIVGDIEERHKGEEFGSFYDDILSNSIATVYCAVASVEAYINEVLLFDERLMAQELRDCAHTLIGKTRILDKYAGCLRLLQCRPLARGKRPYQDVYLLILLRNALTHFIPEWENQQNAHAVLSRKLRAKIHPPSPFCPSGPLFPQAWATHACTLWAVNSSKGFMIEFEKLAQLPPRIQMFEARLQG